LCNSIIKNEEKMKTSQRNCFVKSGPKRVENLKINFQNAIITQKLKVCVSQGHVTFDITIVLANRAEPIELTDKMDIMSLNNNSNMNNCDHLNFFDFLLNKQLPFEEEDYIDVNIQAEGKDATNEFQLGIFDE